MYNTRAHITEERLSAMPHTIVGPYIDQEQNIIAFVVHDNKTFDIYKKIADAPFVRIAPPASPYILFEPSMERFSAFKMDDKQHLYELGLKSSTDLYTDPRNKLNINKLLHQSPSKEITLGLLNQAPWSIPENIPQDNELEALIFPPVEPAIDEGGADVDNIEARPSIQDYAANAIAAVPSNLPEDVKATLSQAFTDYLELLNHVNALVEINKLLNLIENDGNGLLNVRQLSEHWISYRFIETPDLAIGDCQSYLLNLFIHLANNYRDGNIDIHRRAASPRTIQAFLMKDYPALPNGNNEEAQLQYALASSTEQERQNQIIMDFIDYPAGTNKRALTQRLNAMIYAPVPAANNLQPHPAIIQNPEGLIPDVPDQVVNFTNTYQPIHAYWQAAIYVDFLAFLWNMCDAVMRFCTYLDIYALRWSETGQMISLYQNLGAELQGQINRHLVIDNDFTTHVANRVWG